MNPRFNPDCSTFDQVVEYYNKRALQLKREHYYLNSIHELEYGAVAFFGKDYRATVYMSLYIYPEYRGKGMFEKFMTSDVEYFRKTEFKHYGAEYYGTDILPSIITSDDCGLRDFLEYKKYDFISVNLYTGAYKVISEFYGAGKAKRSGVDFMNHIDEGFVIAQILKFRRPNTVMRAYCLHPIFQTDKDLVNFLQKDKTTFYHTKLECQMDDIIYAMEYRSVANEYLSTRKINSIEEIRLSPLQIVNDMLIIDKIQNRKDFDLYHKDTHPRSAELTEYFDNWFKRLGITSEMYNKCLVELTPKIIYKK